MTSYRIDYIMKPNPYQRIQKVGDHWPQHWECTEDAAIQLIRSGQAGFFTEGGGCRAQVGVEWNHNPPYLKTHPDGTKLDNLLFLPNVA